MNNPQLSSLGVGAYASVCDIGGQAVKSISHKNFESAAREVSLINACDHQNVIKIINVEYTSTDTLIYMKKYRCDLLAYMKENIPVDIQLVYAISRDIISGIAHIHSRGIIHSDIKPQNILLELDKTVRAVICDFGIAVISKEKYHTSRVQTCTYRAPEVDYDKTRIQYSNRIDMWSVGCILFELATGGAAVCYDSGTEDSSIYACRLFRLCECKNRKERLRLLRDVTLKYIHMCICNQLSHNPTRYKILFDSGFINLIALCLHPNHNKRVDAGSAFSLINHMLQAQPTNAIVPRSECVVSLVVSVDEMSCIQNIPEEVITKCTTMCLNLAEAIYRKVAKVNDDQCDELKYASIFIATCIFSGSNSAKSAIKSLISQAILLGYAIKIMSALGGKIL